MQYPKEEITLKIPKGKNWKQWKCRKKYQYLGK